MHYVSNNLYNSIVSEDLNLKYFKIYVISEFKLIVLLGKYFDLFVD